MNNQLEPNSEIVRLLRQWGDGQGQSDACKMFQRYPDPRAKTPLQELLQKEKNPDTRVIAAEVLGKIGDKQAILVLSNVAKNDKGKNFEGRTVATTARAAIAEIRARSKTTQRVKNQ